MCAPLIRKFLSPIFVALLSALPRWIVQALFMSYWAMRGVAVDVLRGRWPGRRYEEYKAARGMSVWHDWNDWLGGYPFEVASPEAIFDFFRARHFTLTKLKTRGGTLGCNEFVFARDPIRD